MLYNGLFNQEAVFMRFRSQAQSSIYTLKKRPAI